MRRRLAVLFVALAATMIAAQNPTAVAAAPPGGGGKAVVIMDSTCPSNHVCLWEDFNYTGSKYVDYTQGTNPGDKFDIDGWNGDNEISSAKNNTGLILVLWDNDNYTAHCRGTSGDDARRVADSRAPDTKAHGAGPDTPTDKSRRAVPSSRGTRGVIRGTARPRLSMPC
ncbi:peptidase inhibitor family I36 protein [Micromonospora sp. HUAS LYJ1]|uniref:peptidase inhibitor family I36 protein n=1 Tax=Micromonospora sp. HUAS LYJ1 TaxID=3061626 RepID=UPI0026728872|nr:peptidase inhibitor family I36 protein [Micromonospora sp. HUAS LYJ1]WKU05616.1 peptidase inhibitor family I36 protein [Micromonospora sp. HUAS LYJ1]